MYASHGSGLPFCITQRCVQGDDGNIPAFMSDISSVEMVSSVSVWKYLRNLIVNVPAGGAIEPCPLLPLAYGYRLQRRCGHASQSLLISTHPFPGLDSCNRSKVPHSQLRVIAMPPIILYAMTTICLISNSRKFGEPVYQFPKYDMIVSPVLR